MQPPIVVGSHVEGKQTSPVIFSDKDRKIVDGIKNLGVCLVASSRLMGTSLL